MNLKAFFTIATAAAASLTNLNSQTLFVPGANGNTPGIGVSTNGNVGVGTNSPGANIEINSTAKQGAESLIRLKVGDTNSDFFEISNATEAPNQFMTYINGFHDTDSRPSIFFGGSISGISDYGNNSVVVFDARYINGPVKNRPLFSWFSYDNNMMQLNANGNLLIGKTTQANTAYKLDVAGKIRADEIVVNTTGADFVFDSTYNLRSLPELETFIKQNKHLPEIAPAKEMQENGVSAGEMQTKLLQKIEELTLYVIEKDKEISEQEKMLKKLEWLNNYQNQLLLEMKKRIESLETRP